MKRFTVIALALGMLLLAGNAVRAQEGKPLTADEVLSHCAGCNMDGVNLQGHDLRNVVLEFA